MCSQVSNADPWKAAHGLVELMVVVIVQPSCQGRPAGVIGIRRRLARPCHRPWWGAGVQFSRLTPALGRLSLDAVSVLEHFR